MRTDNRTLNRVTLGRQLLLERHLGTVRGTWKLLLGRDSATLTVTPLERLSRQVRDEVEVEAHQLLAFAAAELDDREVRWS
ncbi:DNA glycosylase AlkZ-like family protein [Kribbella lupini]|uniref:Uncharacterized protein n=1 Tax=Kribbella lupini TaxID=291602 RepID=A0ABN2B4G0_9ACTN